MQAVIAAASLAQEKDGISFNPLFKGSAHARYNDGILTPGFKKVSIPCSKGLLMQVLW